MVVGAAVGDALVCCACASVKAQLRLRKSTVVVTAGNLAKADRWLVFIVLNPSSRCRISLWHNLFPEGVASEFSSAVQPAVGILKCCICVAFGGPQPGEALAKDVLL